MCFSMGIKLYNYPTNLNCTVLLQKNVVRFISQKKPIILLCTLILHLKSFWSFLKLICFKLESLRYFHNISILPEIFNEMCSVCSVTNKVHSYDTRNSNTIYLFPAWMDSRRFVLDFRVQNFSVPQIKIHNVLSF